MANESSTPRPPHLAFLRTLTGDQGEELFPLDSRGRLTSLAPLETADPHEAQTLLLKRRGLGRVAIARGELSALASPGGEALHRRMTAFLWKMRHDREREFVDTGRWTPAAETPAEQSQFADPRVYHPQQRALIGQELARLRPRDAQLAPVPIQSVDHLLDRLMPQGLKILPLPLVGLLLVLYVVAIGPVDYLLLGALRRRKWTWVLFPATTVAFALATVGLANWYMRVSDVPRRVTICDLGEDNSVARSNRFEALFRGAPSTVAGDVSRGLFAAMNLQRFSYGTAFMYQQAQATGTKSQFELIGAAHYMGRVPTQYAVAQYLPQWTPQLNRVFSLSEPDDAVKFDWQAFADATGNTRQALVSGSGDARQNMVSRLQQAFGREVGIFVATGNTLQHLAGDRGVLQDTAQTGYGHADVRYSFVPGYVPQTGVTFLRDICANATPGLFGVVSQLSPTGGDDFEDLSLLDPSDPAQWLLIVVVPRGNDLVVYRKLYSGGN
jgi:hypothetical protein